MESHSSLSWFSCGSSILIDLEFEDVGFCGGRKSREPEENTSKQGENQTQPTYGTYSPNLTQPTYGTGPESNPGHIAGRRALSSLCHPCSPNPKPKRIFS